MSAPVDLNEPDYRTALLGMKPYETYHYRISVKSGDIIYLSEDRTIETGPTTNLITLDDFDIIDETVWERGFIAITAEDVAFIIDPDGAIMFHRGPLVRGEDVS